MKFLKKPTKNDLTASLLLMLLALTLIALTGCTTTRTTAITVDTSCGAFVPITYSGANDTAETISQIRAHNAVIATLCPQHEF